MLREATLREAAYALYRNRRVTTVGWIRRQAIRLDMHNANFASGGVFGGLLREAALRWRIRCA
nr:hypothetical protein [Methylomarinum sp. Ch1-1]MDP4522885.1 hypothetical protein [Methylomarinum sp. Ch1-1]